MSSRQPEPFEFACAARKFSSRQAKVICNFGFGQQSWRIDILQSNTTGHKRHPRARQTSARPCLDPARKVWGRASRPRFLIPFTSASHRAAMSTRPMPTTAEACALRRWHGPTHVPAIEVVRLRRRPATPKRQGGCRQTTSVIFLGIASSTVRGGHALNRSTPRPDGKEKYATRNIVRSRSLRAARNSSSASTSLRMRLAKCSGGSSRLIRLPALNLFAMHPSVTQSGLRTHRLL